MAKLPAKRAESAGGVVYSLVENTCQVIICGRISTGIWTLPKGTPSSGEGIEEAAIREVEEETGLAVEIVTELGAIDYWFVGMPERVRYHKVVYHFLMRPVGGDIAKHDWEFDIVKWAPIDEAYRLLSYDNEKDILLKARDALRQLEEPRGEATSKDAAV
ncbi:MAG: NUDIX hydrolase [Chloroflexi bacterium]|nr:NUDIX hydrolase [Chloroflexota bacterium]